MATTYVFDRGAQYGESELLGSLMEDDTDAD